MRRGVLLMLLVAALPLSLVLATGIGTTPIPPRDIAAIFLNQTGWFHFPIPHAVSNQPIILEVRLPRVLEGALVGAALAVAGALFQGLLRNPLADPYLLGTSSGAALGATVAYLLPGTIGVVVVLPIGSQALTFSGDDVIPILAFGGALVAILLVYQLARVQQRTPVVSLILAGVAVSALLGAVQTVLITQNSMLAQRLGSLFTWLAGSITGVIDAALLGFVALCVAIGIVAALALAPRLDAFALGEEGATHLGIDVERTKLLVVTVAALLVAAAVALSGIVSFVGLFVPHICRMLFGPRHRLLLPVVAVAGSIFVIWADVLARSFLSFAFHNSAELPLGVITALVGGPFFLWLLRRAGQGI